MREGQRDGALTVGLGRGGGSTEGPVDERRRTAALVLAGRRQETATGLQELAERGHGGAVKAATRSNGPEKPRRRRIARRRWRSPSGSRGGIDGDGGARA